MRAIFHVLPAAATRSLCLLFLLFAGNAAVAQADAARAEPVRVLIIGDSISIQGYTKFAAQALAGEMELHHHKGNAQTTRNGLKKLDAWLAEDGGQWDVIHFNWGLWDLVEGGTVVPLDEYAANLEKLVAKLKQTDARLVFATTTPVPPENGRHRRDADVQAYNAVAVEIMKRNGIAIDDLYAFIQPTVAKHQVPNDVHFKKSGYRRLAKSVVKSLRKATDLSPVKQFADNSLKGWRVAGSKADWSIDGGVLTGKSDPKRTGSILWSEKEYRDFTIQLDFRFAAKRVDSGVFLRNENEQIQIGVSGSLNRDMTGSPYIASAGSYPVEAKDVAKLLKMDDWNKMRITARGSQYTVWLNGAKVLDYDSPTAIKQGPIGFQVHRGLDMTIKYRNVTITELPGKKRAEKPAEETSP